MVIFEKLESTEVVLELPGIVKSGVPGFDGVYPGVGPCVMTSL
jgi:hypothetical protein